MFIYVLFIVAYQQLSKMKDFRVVSHIFFNFSAKNLFSVPKDKQHHYLLQGKQTVFFKQLQHSVLKPHIVKVYQVLFGLKRAFCPDIFSDSKLKTEFCLRTNIE